MSVQYLLRTYRVQSGEELVVEWVYYVEKPVTYHGQGEVIIEQF